MGVTRWGCESFVRMIDFWETRKGYSFHGEVMDSPGKRKSDYSLFPA